MPPTLLSLNTAPIGEFAIAGHDARGEIGKRSVEGRHRVHAGGIGGDENDDTAAHGALGKAVYAYPSEHYPFWETVLAQAGVGAWGHKLPFGALGEDLTLADAPLESGACIGDLLCFPDCTLAVSEPRFPSAELDAALGFAHASKAMRAQAWCGYYLAVRVPGTLAAGDVFEWRPGPREITIAELFRSRSAA